MEPVLAAARALGRAARQRQPAAPAHALLFARAAAARATAARAAAASTAAAPPSGSGSGDFASDMFTETSTRRQPSPIRAIFPLLQIPGMISFGGGMPNPSTFPISKLTVDVRTGARDGRDKTLTLEGASLASALQYTATPGFPALHAWLTTLQQREHGIACGPPETATGATHDVTVTTGSQDGLAKVFEMVVAPGDIILIEEASYSGSLAFLTPLGATFATVRTDAHGIIPESLEEVLASFPQSPRPTPPSSSSAAAATDGAGGIKAGSAGSTRPTALRPRVLYTIPTGSNPTGASLTAERKRAIYEIARRPENDLLILEDDPYYYLRFQCSPPEADGDGSGGGTAAGEGHSSSGDRGGDDGNGSNPQAGVSFLSLDVDSRVVRFDSFSKVISAGLRLGFVTAPPAVSDRLRLHMQATLLHTCGLSQAVTAALLTEWGNDGFLAHTREVAAFYQSQRDAFLRAAERHLGAGPKGLGPGRVTWTVPDAGMFVWLDLSGLGVADTRQLVLEDCREAKVLFVPGEAFVPGGTASTHLRASFSTASPDDMDGALKRFADVLRRKFIAKDEGPQKLV